MYSIPDDFRYALFCSSIFRCGILDILFGFGSPIEVGNDNCAESGMVIVVLGFLSHFGVWCIVYVDGGVGLYVCEFFVNLAR